MGVIMAKYRTTAPKVEGCAYPTHKSTPEGRAKTLARRMARKAKREGVVL